MKPKKDPYFCDASREVLSALEGHLFIRQAEQASASAKTLHDHVLMLIDDLKSDDVSVQIAACDRVSRIGPYAVDTFPVLLEKLESPQLQRPAMAALIAIGPCIAPAIRGELEVRSHVTRHLLKKILHALGQSPAISDGEYSDLESETSRSQEREDVSMSVSASTKWTSDSIEQLDFRDSIGCGDWNSDSDDSRAMTSLFSRNSSRIVEEAETSEGPFSEDLSTSALFDERMPKGDTVSEAGNPTCNEAEAIEAAGQDPHGEDSLDSLFEDQSSSGEVLEHFDTDVVGRDGHSASILRAQRTDAYPINFDRIPLRTLCDVEHPESDNADYALTQARLGEGGLGVVHLAFQESLRREVAIKTIRKEAQHDEASKRFVDEATVTAGLDHPNIVPIHDLGRTDDNTLFYSMKKISGKGWHEIIGRSSELKNIDILLKVADALAYAHSHKILHSDLKPENVMLGDFGEVFLMDWGAAIDLDRLKRDGTYTLQGTPEYAAPEIFSCAFAKIGYASDVYLLGAVLFQIVTGSPPRKLKRYPELQDDNAPEEEQRRHRERINEARIADSIANKIQGTKARRGLVAIARKAMATEPAYRYQSVADFRMAVEDHYERRQRRLKIITRFAAALCIFLVSLSAAYFCVNVHLLHQMRQQNSDLPGRTALEQEIVSVAKEYELKVPSRQREPLVRHLEKTYRNDPASAIHGASGWLLRQWGHEALASAVDQTPVPYDSPRKCYTVQIDTSAGGSNEEPSEDIAVRSLYMILIDFPSGTYEIGPSEDELNRESGEARRTVQLSQPFAILDREISCGEFETFAPSFSGYAHRSKSTQHAMVKTSWYDAMRFCGWLTTQAVKVRQKQTYADPESLDQQQLRDDPSACAQCTLRNWPLWIDRPGFRLPSEAEWEIACSSGIDVAYSFGSDAGLLARYAWFRNNSSEQVHVPRLLRANLRGLFDVHGNVKEWCHNIED